MTFDDYIRDEDRFLDDDEKEPVNREREEYDTYDEPMSQDEFMRMVL